MLDLIVCAFYYAHTYLIINDNRNKDMSAWALASAAASAAGSIINSSISNKQSLIANKKYFDYTLPKNQQAQYEMIRNSPVEQVRGLRNAGLNPASISSSYEGSGVTGESGVQTTPLNVDPVGAYMQAKQLEMAEAQNKANVMKTNEETKNLQKQNEWFDRVQSSNIAAQDASTELLKNQSKEIKDLLPGKIQEQSKNINLLDLNISYQQALNDAMETVYDFNGQKIKGKDIPNFQTLFALQMSEKTLSVDWYNAITSRQALERDPMAVLTKEWFAPLVKALSSDVEGLTPEIKQLFQQNVNKIKDAINGISNVGINNPSVSDFVSDPFGSAKSLLKNEWNKTQLGKDINKTRKYLKDFKKGSKDWYKRFISNTRNGSYF